MSGRRSSARLAAQSQNSSQGSSPPTKSSPAGTKRKNETTGSSPSAKRGKKHVEPEQKTLEETIQNGHTEHPATQDHDAAKKEEQLEDTPPKSNGSATESKEKEDKPAEAQDTKMTDAQAKETQDGGKVDQHQDKEARSTETNGDAVEPGGREADLPSTILEKGIIYFFFRARVNVDDPQDTNDIARSYMVLRPIPLDARLGDGPIGDQGNCRLLSLPKKVLPSSGKDKFMVFVEKAETNFEDLKESFMTGSEYATKTAGTSHVPSVTPLAEGVYAITSTGKESHLAYTISIPAELSQVQKDLGLRERGSFVTSVKNPAQPSPANTSLPKGPDYPQEILDEFRSLRWKPLEPKHLDFVNTQFLLIGESFDHAMEGRPKDERENKATPVEEMERLEGEDEIRVKHLKGDDTVFVDLGISAKEFPKVPTTW